MGKCYFAHGGTELVIAGRLTFLPGASVEGADGLFDLPAERCATFPLPPDSTATTVARLREDYNRLLAALRGQLPADPATPTMAATGAMGAKAAAGATGVMDATTAPPADASDVLAEGQSVVAGGDGG